LEILTEFDAANIQIIVQPQISYLLQNPSNSTEVRNVYSRGGDFLPRVKLTLYKTKKILINKFN